MKKSKLVTISGNKTGIKKASKNKKSFPSVVSKALKNTAQKLLVKLTSNKDKSLKAKSLPKSTAMAMAPKTNKKPQVKVQAKAPVKVLPKNISAKSLPVKAPTSVIMNTKAPAPKSSSLKTPPVKPGVPVIAKDKKSFVKTPPVKEIKKPVVAAVLVKPLTKPLTKPVKPVKATKVGSVSSERMCRELSCENVSTTKGYCRLDYIKNWKKIKRKEMILKEGKLNQYIEELVGKYPDKYIDVIRQDLSTEVNFTKVIHDLELDESIDDLDYDGDSIDALIGGIKKDIEDFGDEEF